MVLAVVAAAAFVSYGPLDEEGAAFPLATAARPLVVPPTMLPVPDEDALARHVSYAFTVRDARPCRVTGRKDVRLLLVTEDDFVNWGKGLAAGAVFA